MITASEHNRCTAKSLEIPAIWAASKIKAGTDIHDHPIFCSPTQTFFQTTLQNLWCTTALFLFKIVSLFPHTICIVLDLFCILFDFQFFMYRNVCWPSIKHWKCETTIQNTLISKCTSSFHPCETTLKMREYWTLQVWKPRKCPCLSLAASAAAPGFGRTVGVPDWLNYRWLARNEPNTLCIRHCGRHCGRISLLRIHKT